MTAYTSYQQQNLDEAAMVVKNVQVDVLSDSMKAVYVTIRDATGVAGIGDEEQPQTDTGEGESYEDESYDESYYDEGYEDESYYDEGYEEEY